MKDIWSYPVSFPYGATTSPYSPSRPHKGEDRAAPSGTPIPVNGVNIGLVGSTGISTGPHLHIQKVSGGVVVHPRGGGKTLSTPAVVIEVGTKSDIGNYVRIKDSKGTIWSYFHLSKILVKQGGLAVKPTKRVLYANRRNYAFVEDTYIVSIPDNKKAGGILHKRGEVIDVGEYTEWPNGKRFYRAKKQVADKDQRGYGRSKLVRAETADIKKVVF